MACMYFTEFAEKGSIYDYIHQEHKKPPLSQMLLWAVQVAEGMYLRPIKKGAKCCLPEFVAVELLHASVQCHWCGIYWIAMYFMS